MPSIKRNFFYSAFLTTANYIFPLLTFPYVTRVLGVADFGLCGFIDSIINYFILFSSMGIAVVGIRETASAKNDRQRLSQTFTDLLAINAIFTIVSVLLLSGATILIPELHANADLMFLGAFKVVFSFLLIEWFYKGIEDFRYITIRSLFVKCLYVAAVFIFVRRPGDYAVYYLLSVMTIVANALVNIFHSRRFISLSFAGLRIKRFVKPLLTYGIYSLLTSFYTTFNVAFLGFVSSDVQVGFYTTATRLYAVFIGIVTAFTGVMMPRMSALLNEGKREEFKVFYSRSVGILSSVTIPAVFFAIIMAPRIVSLLAGEGYEGAVVPMRIVMPLLFVIGYEQIMIVQGLMPLKRDRTVLRNSIIGAAAGVSANFLLTPRYAAVGSAVVWLICEILIMVLSQVEVKRVLSEGFPLRSVMKNLGAYLPLAGLLWCSGRLPLSDFPMLCVAGIIALIYFLAVQIFIFPDTICGQFARKLLPERRMP